MLESPTPAPVSEPTLSCMFKADREERARARSASSLQTVLNAGPFKPPEFSPRTSQTPPALTNHNRPRNANRISSSGMFAMELDGESAGSPYGPAFSTPYSERISAARSSRFYDQSAQGGQSTMNSEALKAFLFSQAPSAPSQGPNPTHRIRSSNLRQEVAPDRSAEILGIEEGLRKVLNLGPNKGGGGG